MAGEEDDSGIDENLSSHEQIDQIYINAIEALYAQARMFKNDYLKSLRKNPEDDPEFQRKFWDLPEHILDSWRKNRKEVLEAERELALHSYEAADTLLEEYKNQLAERTRFKIAYLRQYGTDQFDIDPDKPAWEQITVEEIVDDFWNNQVGRN